MGNYQSKGNSSDLASLTMELKQLKSNYDEYFNKIFQNCVQYEINQENQYFGNVDIIQGKGRPNFLLVLKEINYIYDREAQQQLINFLNRAFKLLHPNLIQLYAVQYIKHETICSSMLKIKLLFDNIAQNLEQEMIEIDSFSEDDIWFLLDSLVGALSMLQQLNQPHQNLRLSTIYLVYTLQNVKFFKLSDKDLMNYESLYDYTIKNYLNEKLMQGVYLSPEQLFKIKMQPNEDYDLFKADIFTLGMLICHICLWKPLNFAYKYILFQVSQQSVALILSEIKIKYSIELVQILSKMLDFNHLKRPDFNQLDQLLQQTKQLQNRRIAQLVTKDKIQVTSLIYNLDQKTIQNSQSNVNIPQSNQNQNLKQSKSFNQDINAQQTQQAPNNINILSNLLQTQHNQNQQSAHFSFNDQQSIDNNSFNLKQNQAFNPEQLQNQQILIQQQLAQFQQKQNLYNLQQQQAQQLLYQSPVLNQQVPLDIQFQQQQQYQQQQQLMFQFQQQQMLLQQQQLYAQQQQHLSSPLFNPLVPLSPQQQQFQLQYQIFNNKNEQIIGFNNNNSNQKLDGNSPEQNDNIEQTKMLLNQTVTLQQQLINQLQQQQQQSNSKQNSPQRLSNTENKNTLLQQQANQYPEKPVSGDFKFSFTKNPQKKSIFDDSGIKPQSADFTNNTHFVQPVSQLSNQIDQNIINQVSNIQKKQQKNINEITTEQNNSQLNKQEINYPDGSKYIGQVVDGKKEGLGQFIFVNGGYYEGIFKNNQMNGQGILYYNKDQKAYQGEWLDDQFNNYGILYNKNYIELFEEQDYSDFDQLGESWIQYEGDFKLDKKDGFGQLKFSNGEMFCGNFVADQVHGYGTITRENGKNQNGYWELNKLIRTL